jgi:hypothetical protein
MARMSGLGWRVGAPLIEEPPLSREPIDLDEIERETQDVSALPARAPFVRVTSDGRPSGGTKVVLVNGAEEMDVSSMVTAVHWSHDAQDVPRMVLELAPDVELDAWAGFLVCVVPSDQT